MPSYTQKQLSKYLSLLLRHRPEDAGIVIDEEGWTQLAALLPALQPHFPGVQRAEICQLVNDDNKGRYQIQGSRLRAVQGHSLPQRPLQDPRTPPLELFHGTSLASWRKIQAQGSIDAMQRNYVHLSGTEQTAYQVARRRSAPHVLLKIRSHSMHEAGLHFFLADNGVWLTATVPLRFVSAQQAKL